MRKTSILGIVAGCAILLAASVAGVWVATADEPAIIESSPTSSPAPLKQYVFEGNTDSQLSQAVRVISKLGYPSMLTNSDNGEGIELWTMAPQETIDSVFGSIDAEITVVETEVIAQ